MRNTKRHAILILAAAFLAGSAAHAQATRTWVSGVGDDANPCSRTAPCKTFAGAISKTAAGGEINVMDPGGFGALTITKSISVVAEGNTAGVLVTLGSSGMVINAASTDVVVLRGLDFEGVNSGGNGIRFLAGAALHVQDCIIRNFAQHGIDFQPSGNAKLYVDDTIISDNGGSTVGGGILVKPGASGTARAHLHNVRLQGNRFGLQVEARGAATVTQSVASGNVGPGFSAISTGTAAVLALDDTAATQNVNEGVLASGVGASVTASNMLVFRNNIGFNNSGGSFISFGNNRIQGNLTAQTQGTITPQAQE